MSDTAKLSQLAEIEGLSVMEMMEAATFDSVAAGICMNKDCDYSTNVEPDCEDGFCENCNTNTVKSCLILGGII
jgi:hypothetical protein